MKTAKGVKVTCFSILVMFTIATSSMAAEILTIEDFKQKIVEREQLIKTADNFIILFDSSSSMNKAFKDTQDSKYDTVIKELLKRNSYLPDLGYNSGLYLYTPWEEIYPMQPYDRDKIASSLDMLPKKPGGATFLQIGLLRIDKVLAKLSGRTAIFLISDGAYTYDDLYPKPEEIVREIDRKSNVCLYLISTAQTAKEIAFLHDLASVNACSRVLPLEWYIDRPEYNHGALFVVSSRFEIQTISDRKVVGLKADPIRFDFDKDDVKPEYFGELKEVGVFLQNHPTAYAVIDGYSDNTGSFEYNMRISRRRAERVGFYLTTNFGIGSHRLVVRWFGQFNEVDTNDTEEGRSKNRRVEIVVGGL